MMKMRLGLIACCTVLGLQTFGETRIFTDAQGRNIEAELEKFEESSSTVTIQRAGSRQSKRVPLSVFSDKDQAYIRDWGRLQALNDSRFKAVISKSSKRDSQKSYGTSASTEVVTDHCFNIRFENGTKNNLENMELEYVIFYEQEQHVGRNSYKSEAKSGTLYKKETITVPARKNVEFTSEKVTLYEWKAYSLAPIAADIEGIRLRLTLTSAGGAKMTREFAYPSKLKYPWTSKTENAQNRRATN